MRALIHNTKTKAGTVAGNRRVACHHCAWQAGWLLPSTKNTLGQTTAGANLHVTPSI